MKTPLTLTNVIYNDSPLPWQITFQNPASPVMEGIINLHNYIFMYLIVVFVVIVWFLARSLFLFYESKNPEPTEFSHDPIIESVWTIAPAFILIAIAMPSFSLLYSMDEIIEPTLTVKVTGHQWYWSYELDISRRDFLLDYLKVDFKALKNKKFTESLKAITKLFDEQAAKQKTSLSDELFSHFFLLGNPRPRVFDLSEQVQLAKKLTARPTGTALDIATANKCQYHYFNMCFDSVFEALGIQVKAEPKLRLILPPQEIPKLFKEICPPEVFANAHQTSKLLKEICPPEIFTNSMLFVDYDSLSPWFKEITGLYLREELLGLKKVKFWELFEFITPEAILRQSIQWINPAVKFDSYMLDEADLPIGGLRLLEVNNRLVLPINTHIRVLVTSADVIHSWAIPSLGIKVDGIPGRLNQTGLFIKREGVFYGQCSELCGVNHGFMPIVIEAVDYQTFANWAKIQSTPKSLEQLINSPDWEIRID